MTAKNLKPATPDDKRVYRGEVYLRHGTGPVVRASVHAFADARAWLGLYFGNTLDMTLSADAASMRELGAHLIAAADASEGKATVLPLPDCTCPTGGSWHRSECPANTYTHPRVSP